MRAGITYLPGGSCCSVCLFAPLILSACCNIVSADVVSPVYDRNARGSVQRKTLRTSGAALVVLCLIRFLKMEDRLSVRTIEGNIPNVGDVCYAVYYYAWVWIGKEKDRRCRVVEKVRPERGWVTGGKIQGQSLWEWKIGLPTRDGAPGPQEAIALFLLQKRKEKGLEKSLDFKLNNGVLIRGPGLCSPQRNVFALSFWQCRLFTSLFLCPLQSNNPSGQARCEPRHYLSRVGRTLRYP